MAKVRTRGFEKVIAKTEQLADNLDDGIERHVDGEVERLKRAIRKEIKRQGLVETGDLLNSFEIRRRPDGEWEVFSTEAHADYLEYGTSAHTIRPNKKQFLAFKPENPAPYGNSYDPETGYVYVSVVDHPGNEDYKFVRNAQAAWAAGLFVRLRQAVRREIVKAGFKPGV